MPSDASSCTKVVVKAKLDEVSAATLDTENRITRKKRSKAMDEQNKSVSDGDAMGLRKEKEGKAVDIGECDSKPPEDKNKKITAAGEATSVGLTPRKKKGKRKK